MSRWLFCVERLVDNDGDVKDVKENYILDFPDMLPSKKDILNVKKDLGENSVILMMQLLSDTNSEYDDENESDASVTIYDGKAVFFEAEKSSPFLLAGHEYDITIKYENDFFKVLVPGRDPIHYLYLKSILRDWKLV